MPQGLPLQGHGAFRTNSLCHISLARPVCPETASDWRLKLVFMVDSYPGGMRGMEMGGGRKEQTYVTILKSGLMESCLLMQGSAVSTWPHLCKKEISAISHSPLRFLPPVSFLSIVLARIKPCDCQSLSGSLRNCIAGKQELGRLVLFAWLALDKFRLAWEKVGRQWVLDWPSTVTSSIINIVFYKLPHTFQICDYVWVSQTCGQHRNCNPRNTAVETMRLLKIQWLTLETVNLAGPPSSELEEKPQRGQQAGLIWSIN